MSKLNSTALLVLCVFIVLSLTVMGCKIETAPSEEAVEEVTEEAAEEVTEEPSGDPIKIGGAFPMTGWYAYDGEKMEAGALMAIEEINAKGGLLGRPLELIIFDIEDMMSEKFLAASSKLVLEDKVDLLSNGWNAMGPDIVEFGKYDVPYLTDGAVGSKKLIMDNYETNWNVLQLGPMESAYAMKNFQANINIPYELPNNKVALIAGDYEWDIVYTGLTKEYAEAEGFEVVLQEIVPYGTRDWSSLLTQIRDLDPALIFIEELDASDQATFMAQFLEDPTNSLVSSCYMVTIPVLLEMGGADFEGVTGYTMCTTKPNDPIGADWKARFEARFGWEPPGGVPPLINYESVNLWATAVENVGDPTDYRAVVDYIIANPYNGIAGVYDFSNDNTVQVTDTFAGAYAAQIQNGKVVLWEEYEDIDYMLPPWIEEPWPMK